MPTLFDQKYSITHLYSVHVCGHITHLGSIIYSHL